MNRIPALAAVAAVLISTAAPAFAGPAESAFLSKLSGSWSGRGNLTGAQSGPIACRLMLKPSTNRVTFSGRCNVQDLGAQGFSGSISYNDKTKRYEARSNAGTVAGIKKGNSLVFTTKTSTLAGRSYSTMTMSASRISIDFTLVDKSGDTTKSRVNFSK